jgi:predicted Zn finger-like uncharacterized protein
MKVACEKCGSVYNIDPNRIPEKGITIKCPRCLSTFTVKPDGTESLPQEPPAQTPEPAQEPAPAVERDAALQETAAPVSKKVSDWTPDDDLPPLPDLPDLPPEPAPQPRQPSRQASVPPQTPKPQVTERPHTQPPSPPPPSTEQVQAARLAPEPPPLSKPPADSVQSAAQGSGLDFNLFDLGTHEPVQPPEPLPATRVMDAKESEDLRFGPSAAEPAPVVEEDKQGSVVAETRLKGRKMRIRRRSGKVFGPFDIDAIVRMIVEHKLLGNEEASEDGVNWTPLGQVPDFAAAIKHMMESPIEAAMPMAPSAAPAAATAPAPQPIKSAAITGDGREKKRLNIKIGIPKLPWWAVASIIGALIVAAGVALAFMDQGFLGYKFIARVIRGGPSVEEKQAQNLANTAIGSDSYADLKKATDSLRSVLKKSRDQGRTEGLYAAMLLMSQFKYGLDQQQQQELDKLVAGLDSTSDPIPEAYFARALYYMFQGSKERTSELLGKMGSTDLATLASGMAAAKARDYKRAETEFNALAKMKPGNTFALRELGDLRLLQGDMKGAAEWYGKALKANPADPVPKMELAGIALDSGEDKDKVFLDLKYMLAESANLHPKEVARAKYLLGRAYMSKKMAKEARESLAAAVAANPDEINYQNTMGRYYLENMEFDDAWNTFTKVIQKDGQNIPANIGIVQAMIEKRKIIEAGNKVAGVLVFAPSNPEVLYLKGVVENELEKYDAAIGTFKSVVNLKKDYLEPRLALARIYLRQGKDQDSLAELDEAKKLKPDSPLVCNARGELLVKKGKYPEAIKEFETALTADQYYTLARFNLGKLLIISGDCKSAVGQIETVIKQVEKYPYGRFYLAQAYHCLKDYKNATEQYQEALKVNPNDTRVLTRAGQAFSESGDSQKGIELIQAAIAYDRTNAEASYQLGMAYRRKGEKDNAVEAFKQAFKRDPSNAQYRFMLGQALLRAGMLVEAQEELKGTAEMEPNWAKVHYQLGRVYFQSHNYRLAMGEFNKAYALDNTRVKALYRIGRCYMEMRDYKEAIRTFQGVAKSFPDFLRGQYMLARAYHLADRMNEAFAQYKKVASLDKKNAMPHYYLGYMYKEKKEIRNATFHFKQYLVMDPDGPYAGEIKDELEFIAKPSGESHGIENYQPEINEQEYMRRK